MLVTRLHHHHTFSFILALYVVVHNILTYLVFSQGNLELSQQEPDAYSFSPPSLYFHSHMKAIHAMNEGESKHVSKTKRRWNNSNISIV